MAWLFPVVMLFPVTVYRKLLFGSMTVTSYSNQEERVKPSAEFLARCSSKVRLTPQSEACCLYPDDGNIHEIQAER